METFILAFFLMVAALSAMAIGWFLKGKALSGSCGGVTPDGKPLADCLCEMANEPVCDRRKQELEARG